MQIGIGIGMRNMGGQGIDAQISAIFATAIGAQYDPQDAATRYQDVNGVTPTAAAEQLVGLMLDKSKGLARGSELLSNGSFASSTGWTLGAAWTVTAGVLRSTPATGATGDAIFDGCLPLIAGRTVEVTFTITERVASQIYFAFGSTSYQLLPAGTGTFTRKYNTTGTDGKFYVRKGDVGASISLDDISIKELLGNHEVQATSASRPKYRTGPQRIVYDGIDDFMTASFPAALGASCTIVRAVPGVGASILTGQAIGTSFIDDQDHAGLLIFNRALTTPETSAVTQWANQRSF